MRPDTLLVSILVACASGVVTPAALFFGMVLPASVSTHLSQFLDDAT